MEAFVSHALLLALRIGGLMTFAPFFGNSAAPNTAKAALALGFTALLLPLYAAAPAPVTTGVAGWVLMALGEAMIGLLMGITTQFVFDGMEIAGQVISFQFGFSLANVIDPNSLVEVTVLSTLHTLATLLIFMQLGVHRWLLRATAMSLEMIPPGSLVSMHLPVEAVLKAAAAMWLVGAEFAFPVLLATLLADFTLGFLSKAAPQFPALLFGISLKVLLGLAVLYGVVGFWPRLLGHYFYQALTTLEHLLTVAR
ncbi:MAG: flagellar biosynthetic protein FliR [Candidatus Acidiferrales bacterium]|jgi:flagellar biosynthetic protein FliR